MKHPAQRFNDSFDQDRVDIIKEIRKLFIAMGKNLITLNETIELYADDLIENGYKHKEVAPGLKDLRYNLKDNKFIPTISEVLKYCRKYRTDLAPERPKALPTIKRKSLKEDFLKRHSQATLDDYMSKFKASGNYSMFEHSDWLLTEVALQWLKESEGNIQRALELAKSKH